MERIVTVVLFVVVLILIATHQEVGIVGQAASAVPASPNFNSSQPPTPSVAAWTCFVETEAEADIDSIGGAPETELIWKGVSFISDVFANSDDISQAVALQELESLFEVNLNIKCRKSEEGVGDAEIKEWIKSPRCNMQRSKQDKATHASCHFILE